VLTDEADGKVGKLRQQFALPVNCSEPKADGWMLKDTEPSLISFGCFTQMFFGPGISRMFPLQFHSSIHFSWKIILKQV